MIDLRKFSFGGPAAIVTGMALIVGLDAATAAKSTVVTSLLIIGVGIWLPFSPLASALGFTPLPSLYWYILAAILAGYMGLTQVVKTWLRRRSWI